MSQNNSTATQVKEVDMDFINDLFPGAPSGDDIITPADTAKKPNVFSGNKQDLSFIDEPAPTPGKKKPEEKPDEKKENPEDPENKEEVSQEDLDDILNIDPNAEPAPDNTGKGRPKTDKSGLVNTFKKLIDSNKIIPFDDDKPLEDYSEKDFEDLLQANFDERERALRESTPQEFYNSLPAEMQYAAKYIADGGTDLKGLFRALSHVEEVRSLDPANENDQEAIVRSYLKATKYGDDSEINEEIATWKELGKLEAKAQGFKPKLDKMNEEIVKSQIAQQEENKKRQLKASEDYVNNVFSALRDGEVNGLKLNKNTQAKLFAGLTQPQYPSISGKQTNLLGHLLEKYQFVEPNHQLISEALWLLSNPDEYRTELRKQGKNTATEETVRALKGAQASKIANGQAEEPETKTPGKRTIARAGSFFAR